MSTRGPHPPQQQEHIQFPTLHKAAFTQPAIDNHAHPLLRASARHALPFEGLISEAFGAALTRDAPHTLACLRATRQLAALFHLNVEGENTTWEEVKTHRAAMDYMDLCKLCFKDAGIECILIDDGLGGVEEMAEGYEWHDQLTSKPTRRIVRVEIVAEGILRALFTRGAGPDTDLSSFENLLKESLTRSAMQEEVVGFKSIVCYRTGMNVSVSGTDAEKRVALAQVLDMYNTTGTIRLAHKALNDEVVRITLEVAGRYHLPVQFHTGLGDSDITLTLSSPAHLQPVIKQYPDTTIVLLHSSYPYTRDAGYLTAVYPNVYLDFGEVFPFVSGEGQRSIIRQVLELTPTNKIMWSSDGHWWPESYYLGIYQARQALYEVLAELVQKEEITEREAVEIVEKSLFSNAKRIYGL